MTPNVDWSQAPLSADYWLAHKFGATWCKRIDASLRPEPGTIPGLAALAPAPTFGAAIGAHAERTVA